MQVSQELREVVVAFRGTEQVKWQDFVSDINLIPQTLDVERTGTLGLGLGTLPLPFATFKKSEEAFIWLLGVHGTKAPMKERVYCFDHSS